MKTARTLLAIRFGVLFSLIAWLPICAAGLYVHIAGETLPAIAAGAESSGVNLKIEKLLVGRPDDLWERVRLGFAIPDLDRKLVSQ